MGGGIDKYFLIMAGNDNNELSWEKINLLSMLTNHLNEKGLELFIYLTFINGGDLYIANTINSLTAFIIRNISAIVIAWNLFVN